MSARVTSAVSAVVAALVPAADAVFHWQLQPVVVGGVVVALLGLAGLELGHAHVAATKGAHETALQRIGDLLGGVSSLLSELRGKTATAVAAPAPAETPTTAPADAGAKAGA